MSMWDAGFTREQIADYATNRFMSPAAQAICRQLMDTQDDYALAMRKVLETLKLAHDNWDTKSAKRDAETWAAMSAILADPEYAEYLR